MDNTPRVLAGRYEVGELIGRGGMAEVHIGHDTRLGRTVAIKVLRSDLARDPSFLARFRREAQAAAALNHPAIVAVYDTGEDVHTDSGGASVHVPFIVMEYVEGHTVRDILRDGAAVPIDEAVEITAGVLSALEYSHHAGIVHRDIKPANVMITPTGAVKVMDFGIARAVADSAATMTQTHAVIGTAQYLSPEQARGETVDARSDLYSTGCLLFELLTGRPPFIGDSPVAVAYQHVGQAPQRPSEIAPDVPEVLDRITLKALAKERGQRYSSAAEFRADLEAAVRGGQVMAPALGAAALGAAAGAGLGAVAATQLQPTAVESATQVMSPAAAATSPWGTTGVPAAVPPGDVPPGEEEPEEEPRRKKALLWTLVVVAVLAIGAIVTMLLLNQNGDDTPEQVTVPVVQAGATKDEVRAQFADLDLTLREAIDPEASGEPDTATGRTDPEGGEQVDAGSTVTVFFATTPDAVGVPDVTGQTQEQARATIEGAGLVWGDVTTENSPTVPKDAVTSTDPGAGQSVASGSTVAIKVSTGNVDLPDLSGMTADEATKTLDDLDLNYAENQVQSDKPEGTVVEQSPAAGSVPQKSRVTIGIAIPKEKEMTTVPSNLVGMTSKEAADALGAAGLNMTTAAASSDTVPAGRVISTNPPSGAQAEVGAQVEVTISTGPEAGNGNGGGGGGNNGGGGGGGGSTPTP